MDELLPDRNEKAPDGHEVAENEEKGTGLTAVELEEIEMIELEAANRAGRRFSAAAAGMVSAAYREEKKAVPCLPLGDGCLDMIRKLIADVFENGRGILAVVGDELVGFLAGYEVEELFGKGRGVYIPVYGHGAAGCRRRLYQKLYQHAAHNWVKRGALSQALTLFAHDREGIDTWFWLGFGLRCVDSIREVSPVEVDRGGDRLNGSDIQIKKVSRRGLPPLAGLHGEHNLYYRSSPIFMPNEKKDPLKDLEEWLEGENHHLWAAYQAGKPLGYLRIEPEGESFVTRCPGLMNITGAYLREDCRGSGIGALLLDAVQRWLEESNYLLCGVDFESINTVGSSFWNKHFIPYTFSLVRRIDERIYDMSNNRI